MIRFEFPKNVGSNYAGYQVFIDLIEATKELDFDTIELDFAKNTWFEANLCAGLGAIISGIEENFNSVKLINLHGWPETILRKNNFLVHFGGEPMLDRYNTTVQYQKYKVSEEKLIKKYLDEDLLQKEEFPEISEVLRKKIGESIFELFSNAYIHGGCTHVYSCGQHYPNKQPPRLDFTIVDMGNTIKKKVSDFLDSSISGTGAIEWAFMEGNTTKQGNHPGGLGLKVIQEFMRANNGKIQIVSADGYWEMIKGAVSTSEYEAPFPGSLINLEFNLDDLSYVQEYDNISIDDIF